MRTIARYSINWKHCLLVKQDYKLTYDFNNIYKKNLNRTNVHSFYCYTNYFNSEFYPSLLKIYHFKSLLKFNNSIENLKNAPSIIHQGFYSEDPSGLALLCLVMEKFLK